MPKAQPKKKESVEGALRIGPSFVGYLAHPTFDTEIEIPNESLKGALPGDTVVVQLTGKQKTSGHFGKVTKIVTRKRSSFVGTLRKVGRSFVVLPDNERIYQKIMVSKKELAGAKSGSKVVAKVKTWGKPDEPIMASIDKILGKPGQHETEMLSILYDKEFTPDFPSDVEKEAKAVRSYLQNEDIKKRKDFRGTTTFTIDPVDAKDFDDALSVKKLDNNLFEVGIHIADVTYFVRPGTRLDQEGAKRATSIYLVDRTIPMLPETLSNDLCSLNPNEEKLAFSAVFQMDKDGNIHKEWFGRTRIKSDKRFTYENAQKTLDTKKGEFYEELTILNNLAKKLRKEKFKKGAIAFESKELRFELDEKMRPVKIIKKDRLDTHMLVEDFMLLANKKVTEYVDRLEKRSKVKHHFIYRVHDQPDEEKIERVLDLLKKLGHEIHRKGKKITSYDINTILAKVAGTPEENLIQTAMVRSMAKAEYTTKNIGHFGLAFPFYTHFTSPIRRYPDVMVHRLLEKYLHNENVSKQEVERYQELSLHSSQRERVAEEAERESKKYKQAEYMSFHVGEEFTGTISGVTRFGMFVQENETLAEGLVAMRSLGDDYYSYDESNLSLVGEKTKRKFQLGDTVKIKVKKVDVRKRQIDYVLVEEKNKK
ncbi:ribonuclease R [bacterium]|nr:ribonuclease R [bacterium]|tara:strand:+ start:12691 stop:14640 length:1950 start_codon:yes stop_codon:yes gene_type:complete